MKQVYRIFIFDSNEGTFLSEEDYVKFPEIQKQVIDWNQNNQDKRKNIYLGTEFPPKSLKFNKEIKQFVAKTFSEQVADGEVVVPKDSKLVGETIVRLTNKELFEKGLITLEYNEKIDDFDNIVQMNVIEMFLQGKATRYQAFEHFFAEVTIKIDEALKKFYNYPIHEMHSWEMKKNQSVNWLQLPNQEKVNLISGEKIGIVLYQMLVTEAITAKDTNLPNIDKVNLVDTQAQKVVTKFKELETVYAGFFAQRSIRKEKLKNIMESNVTAKEMISAMESVVNEQL